MAETSPFGVAALVAPVEPRQLGLHLEICRMQAELDVVTRRIAGHGSGAGRPGGPDPADEAVIGHLVSSLLEAGRDQLRADEEQCRAEVKATLDAARRRADEVVASARAELTAALEERTARTDAPPAGDLEALYRAAAARSLAPAVSAPVMVAVAPSVTEPDASPGSTPAAPVVSTRPSSGRPTPVVPPSIVPAPQPPAAPVLGPLPHPPPSAPAAGPSAEESAFATWMAVAGIQGPPHGLDLGTPERSRARRRPHQVRLLEVAGVLLAVAILVVVALVVLG